MASSETSVFTGEVVVQPILRRERSFDFKTSRLSSGVWKTAGDWTVCRVSSKSAVSLTDRVNAKLIDAPCHDRQLPGPTGIRPRVGFKPMTPHQLAGILIEPPPSLPAAIGTQPAATAAPAPPDEPPGVNCGFQGLRAGPKSLASVMFL